MKTFMSWPARILRKMLWPVYYFEKFLFSLGVKSTQNLTLPDFLCIGVQKAGTTWLYENLKMHSGIFMPDKKEIDYFSNSHKFYCYPLTFYTNYFSQGDTKL